MFRRRRREPRTEPSNSRVNSLGDEEEPAKTLRNQAMCCLNSQVNKIFQLCQMLLLGQERCSSQWARCDQERSCKMEEALAGVQMGDLIKKGDTDEGEPPCSDLLHDCQE